MRPTGTVPVALLEDTKVGDVAAFASLYSLYKRGVHALCLRMTGDVLDAEDLTQEVFLQIHRKIINVVTKNTFTQFFNNGLVVINFLQHIYYPK